MGPASRCGFPVNSRAGPAMPSRSDRSRILIVDDNEAIHRDFQKVLSGALADASEFDAIDADLFGDCNDEEVVAENSFALSFASQGAEGFALVRDAVASGNPFSVAFVDVRMPPGWDGIKTVAEMWKVDSNLQVVLCTAYSDYSFEQTTAALGRTDRLVILRKPFENIEVRQLAHSLSQKWTVQQQLQLRIQELEAANAQIRAEMIQRQEAETALKHGQRMQAIGTLASGISHEVRNPLQIISMNLEIMESVPESMEEIMGVYSALLERFENGNVDASYVASFKETLAKLEPEEVLIDIKQATEEARDGVRVIADTIYTMNQFSRQGEVGKDSVNINDILCSTIKFSRGEYSKFAELQCELGEIPLVRCNRTEIGQVFLNLLVNASHAIRDQFSDGDLLGTIRVRTGVSGDHVVITIEDTGGGISDEIRDRIFDPFFTTKDVGEGTGQGLAISHRIVVESHNGLIKVDSSPSGGTIFSVLLPY